MALTKILQEGIKDGEIVNADINASAAIATSKISGLATSATTDTTNAANISSGTLPDARYSIELSRDTTPQLGGNLDVNTKNIVFGDSGSSSDDRLQFGASQDLNIFHDGTDSHIRNNEGKLIITQDDSGGDDLHLRAKANEESIICHRDGQVELYYNNVIRLTTDAAGVVVTGNLYQVDNDKLLLGNSSDLEIFHDGSNSYIKDVGTGSLLIRGSTVSIQSTSGEAMIEGVADGAVTIKHDNNKVFETLSAGIRVQRLTAGSTYIELQNSGGVAGYLYGESNNQIQLMDREGHAFFKGVKDGAAEVYYDNVKKIETESNGATVTGRLRVQDSGNVDLAITDTSSNAVAAYVGVKTAGHVEYNCYKSGVGTKYPHVFAGYTEEYARIDTDGIKFNGDTAAANALDDYEEGTFSPIVKRLMTNNTTETNYYTHTHRQGVYTRVGNRVWITGRCHWSGGSTGSGSLILTSLPYSVSSTNGGANEVPLNIGYRSGLNYTNISGYAVTGMNRFIIFYFDSNGSYAISPSTGNSTGSIYFHATYEVA
tara:strand:+ start:815 stop:2440 length:1626 start_codon:yes stop_codon:yes gene_type:complete